MDNILRGYEPKNKRLTRLKNKARLQLVLNRTITPDVTEEIRKVVGCEYCKYHRVSTRSSLDNSVTSGGSYIGCTKVGIKVKKYAMLITKPAGKDKIIPVMQILYCTEFTEIPEEIPED